MTVTLTGLTERQRQSWLGLIEVAANFPTGWCLVGGQMVPLFCQERGFSPSRPTDDGDVVLDVSPRCASTSKPGRSFGPNGLGLAPEVLHGDYEAEHPLGFHNVTLAS